MTDNTSSASADPIPPTTTAATADNTATSTPAVAPTPASTTPTPTTPSVPLTTSTTTTTTTITSPTTYITTPKPLAPPPTTTSTPSNTSASKKRSHEDSDDDDDGETNAEDNIVVEDDDDDEIDFKFNCNQVRNKINALLRSGEMKVTEFQTLLGINSNSFQRFMKLKGPTGGIDNQTYHKAGIYFYKREKGGNKIKRRKVDKVATAKVEQATNSVELPGEKDETVPIFDSCDEIRRKINAYLRDSGSTQAAFLRSIGAMFNPPVNVQTNQLNEFMKKKGPTDGAASRVYYGAYVFFEKQRIAEDKPKSKTREEMEAQWGAGGVPRERGNAKVLVRTGEIPVIDKYGKIHVVPE